MSIDHIKDKLNRMKYGWPQRLSHHLQITRQPTWIIDISNIETIVRIPIPLRTLTGSNAEAKVNGVTVAAVIEDLEKRYPDIQAHLLDDKGIRRFVNIFVDDEDIRFLEGLKTALTGNKRISIVPAIAEWLRLHPLMNLPST